MWLLRRFVLNVRGDRWRWLRHGTLYAPTEKGGVKESVHTKEPRQEDDGREKNKKAWYTKFAVKLFFIVFTFVVEAGLLT